MTNPQWTNRFYQLEQGYIIEMINLIETIQDRGVTLRQTAYEYHGRCPFCESGRFTVNPARGLFDCADCKGNGNSVRFTMLAEKVDRAEAIERLAQLVAQG